MSAESTEGKPSETESPGAVMARWRGQELVDFSIEFYDRVLQRNPSYVDVLRVQGELLSCKGWHRRAVQVDRRLVELLPDDGVVRYNLACSLAQTAALQEAILQLRRALELGYHDFDHLDSDPDIDPLRAAPEYQQLVREYRDN